MHLPRLTLKSASHLASACVVTLALFCSSTAFAQTPGVVDTGFSRDTTRAGLEVVHPGEAPQTQAPENNPGGEANLVVPDLTLVTFMGMTGHNLLLLGLIFCVLGLVFGLWILRRVKNMPVHRSMREISELIYETCKTYLITQGKFLAMLWVFIAIVIGLY